MHIAKGTAKAMSCLKLLHSRLKLLSPSLAFLFSFPPPSLSSLTLPSFSLAFVPLISSSFLKFFICLTMLFD